MTTIRVIDVNALSNIDFRFYLWLFLRRLPLFLIVALIVAIIGIVAVFLRPTTYEAAAKILVESPQIPTELAKSTVPTDAAEQFQIIQEDVLSRDNLIALANRFGLYANRPALSQSDIFDDMTKRLTISEAPVESSSGTAASVIHIAFRADRPDTAADLVNDLVAMILNKDVQLRTERAAETVTFFTNETQRLEGLLRDLDSKILAFKNEHINSMPDSLDFRRNQQTTQQERLVALAQEEATLRKQMADLQTRPFDIGTAVPLTPEEQSLQALRQSLAQQQALFAEDSPAITSLRSRIATLQGGISSSATTGTDKPQNARDFQLSDINSRLTAIADERKAINQSIADLDASIAATPSNETVLNSLTRDHQNIQAQYDTAVGRLAEASTGQQIELLLKGERLSLIESAIPPQRPTGPNSKVLMAIVGVLALLLGLAATIIPELLNRRIRRPAELVSRLQIMPYITIPYVERTSLRRSGPMPRLSSGFAGATFLLAVQGYFVGVKDFIGQARSNVTSALFRNHS